MRICYMVWPWLFVVPVLSNRAARAGSRAGVWGITAVSTVFGSGVAIAFSMFFLTSQLP